MPRRPERPAPRSGTPPGGPLALTACETARCQCRSTAGQRQGAWPRSVPGPATRGPGCNPPPRSAPQWTRCPTTAACTRGMHDDGGAGGSKQPWSARDCGGADVGQGPIARLLHTRGPNTRFAVTLPSPDTPFFYFSQKIIIWGIKILFVSASGRRRLPARAMPAFGVAGRAVLPLLKSEVSILTF